MPTTPWVMMLEKCSNRESNAQECSIVRWKCFIQEYATWNARRYSWVGGLSSPWLTLEPSEELLDPMATGYLGSAPWTVLPWLKKSCLVRGWQFHGEWTASCLEGCHSDTRRSKQISLVNWFACCLPLYWGFYQLTGRSQWPGHMVRQRAMENWPINRMPI